MFKLIVFCTIFNEGREKDVKKWFFEQGILMQTTFSCLLCQSCFLMRTFLMEAEEYYRHLFVHLFVCQILSANQLCWMTLFERLSCFGAARTERISHHERPQLSFQSSFSPHFKYPTHSQTPHHSHYFLSFKFSLEPSHSVQFSSVQLMFGCQLISCAFNSILR